jgi:AcrR family transcriptional regulator
MREWVPVSSSAKGRLALAAVEAFGARPFEAVTVGELAAAARVTTGALYHHFGSKRGLYAFVREDVERRLLDRMEGAVAASVPVGDRSAAVTAALLAGFDFAVREGFARLLGAPPPPSGPDRLADLLSALTASASAVLGRVLAASWRAAVVAVAEGESPPSARAALVALEPRIPAWPFAG